MNAAAEAEFNILLATDSYKVELGWGSQGREQRELGRRDRAGGEAATRRLKDGGAGRRRGLRRGGGAAGGSAGWVHAAATVAAGGPGSRTG